MTDNKETTRCPYCEYENTNSGLVSQHLNVTHRGKQYTGDFKKPNSKVEKKVYTNKSVSHKDDDDADSIE